MVFWAATWWPRWLDLPDIDSVVALDVREVPASRRVPGVTYVAQDIRAPELRETMEQYSIDSVVHLAAIVTPGGEQQSRTRILGRRAGHLQCAEGLRRRRRVAPGGVIQRRGLWLPCRQPGLDRRGPGAARQRELCLFAPQAAGRGNAGRLPQAPSGAAADSAAHRHHPGRTGQQPDHGAVRQAAHPGSARQRQPLRLHLGRRRHGLHRPCHQERAHRLLQRRRATAR